MDTWWKRWSHGWRSFFFPLLRLGSPIPLADDKLTTSLWLLFQKCPKDIPIVFFSNWNKALFDLGRLLFFFLFRNHVYLPHPSPIIQSWTFALEASSEGRLTLRFSKGQTGGWQLEASLGEPQWGLAQNLQGKVSSKRCKKPNRLFFWLVIHRATKID